ncbi:hypothetical protein BT67DRAFT_374853 [Trichocladium antarcticum]|uniref:Mediator of RNA polymerase II transcription subunit 17 n=1 Tax=Trichocladium antarcticum TaxID=1450529 RepID=A0AAN6UPR0_9PEZI|nr:hypothetical protein BT67DRAFT_374853 [Trichocladium antarcticum]
MNDRPFSLQPRPAPSRGPQSIAEFIQRANAEPGGFRAINEADLDREIEADARQDGADRDEDVAMAGDTSEAGSEATESKDVTAARDELLRTIHLTHQTSMLALDFVSLLVSKENPAQAVATFSPGLRDMVGIGTLGATKLDAPTALTQSRVPDNKMVAIGKRLMDLSKAADAALAASKKLQREIGSETKYWSEVLAVSDAGWQTFRLPHEPQTMGVKFGFNNASPEFKANSIAPMRRSEDGSVRLDHGKMGGGSKRLRVRVLENGRVVGTSSLPRPLPAGAPLQDRVKESRDTIFAQELWHEINREGRTLVGRGVRLEKSAVTYAMDPTRTISLELATVGDEDEGPGAEQPGPQDTVAESLCIALGILLSHAHRANEQGRSEPGATTRGPPRAYSILSPLISYHAYDKTVQNCVQSLAGFVHVLRTAGLDSTVTVKEPALSADPGGPASAALAAALLRSPTVQFDLAITPASRVRILLQPSPLYGTVFTVACLPGPPPGARNPLAGPAAPGADEHDRIGELLWYLHWTVPHALTAHYKTVVRRELMRPPGAADNSSPSNDGGGGSPDPPAWAVDANNRGIVDYDTGTYGVHFDFGPSPDTGGLELRVTGDFVDDGRDVHREWTWPGAGETLDAVVRQVLAKVPRG